MSVSPRVSNFRIAGNGDDRLPRTAVANLLPLLVLLPVIGAAADGVDADDDDDAPIANAIGAELMGV